MMKRNKIITSLMAALLISSMLTACGGQSEQTTDVPEEDVPAASEVQETEEETEIEEPETETLEEEPEAAEEETTEETEPEVTEEETEVSSEETTDDVVDESGSTDFSDYKSAYLSKVTEYNDNGTADNFALIEINGVETPILAAANSEGPLEEEGNAHIFIAPDGNLSELLSVSQGYDGNHIYISDAENTVLWTSGMSGTEIFMVYTINGSELEITDELYAVYDIENETYTYRLGETEISLAEYQDKFAEIITSKGPYTGVDVDGLNKVNISNTDGFLNYEPLSTDKYLSFDEIKAQLEK
ncbi:hypothetical protein [Butyrivibrio sp. AE3006]|uniref:hypothetical protein n=1 Tax=Butyrivibrio sp. AE3006 TaxID=1280673 RepID=UPI000406617E|nr:hypothetical protein [Butyrivibrio sp. AE3006]